MHQTELQDAFHEHKAVQGRDLGSCHDGLLQLPRCCRPVWPRTGRRPRAVAAVPPAAAPASLLRCSAGRGLGEAPGPRRRLLPLPASAAQYYSQRLRWRQSLKAETAAAAPAASAVAAGGRRERELTRIFPRLDRIVPTFKRYFNGWDLGSRAEILGLRLGLRVLDLG